MQAGVRQQCKETRALDRGVNLALIVRLGAGQTCRHDFAVFLDEILERVDVLVINLLYACCSEAAEFLALEQRILLFTLVFHFVLVESFTECHLGLLKINYVKYEAFAVPVFACHESREVVCFTHLSLVEFACNLA